MRFPRRLMASVAVSTLITAGLTGCTSGDDTGQSGPPIVIGADLARNSAVDKAYENALTLKVAQLNASGALGGRTLELRVEDNGRDRARSLRNITAFADDPTVAAVVTGYCGECAIAAAARINEKRIPTIALAAADAVSSPVADRRYLFKLGPNAADSSTTIATELQRRGAKTAALLYSEDTDGTDGKVALEAQLKAAGIKVDATAAVRPGSTDLTPPVKSLIDGKPAALIVSTGPTEAALAARTARANRFEGATYFDATAASDMFIPQDAADAIEETTLVSTQILAINDIIATTPAKASRKRWFQDYTSKFGNFSGAAAFAADAADLIAAAAARAGGDRDQIRDILETSQIDGLSGPIRLTPDNHSGLMPQAMVLLVARSGRWRIAG